MWQGLMLVATISFAVARLMQRALLKNEKHDAITYSIYFQLLVSFIILPAALLNNFAIPSLEWVWQQFILMIFLYGFFGICFYKAIKQTPVSEVMIIAATAPIWTAITSILFLGDIMDFKKLSGVVLAVIGVVFVFYQKHKFRLHEGHLYAFLSTVFLGSALTNDSFLLRYFNHTTYSFLYYFLPSLFIALINPKKTLSIKPLLSKNASLKFFIPAVLYAVSSLLTNMSLKIGAQASQVSVLMQLSPIFTIALGVIFLNERENLIRKLIGGIIVIIAVLLI